MIEFIGGGSSSASEDYFILKISRFGDEDLNGSHQAWNREGRKGGRREEGIKKGKKEGERKEGKKGERKRPRKEANSEK